MNQLEAQEKATEEMSGIGYEFLTPWTNSSQGDESRWQSYAIVKDQRYKGGEVLLELFGNNLPNTRAELRLLAIPYREVSYYYNPSEPAEHSAA